MSYIVLAWLAALTYAAVGVSSKLVTKYSVSNPWLMNFVWSVFIAFNLWIIGLFMGIGIPNTWGSLIVVGIYNCLLGIFYVLALYRLDVSVLSPFGNLRTAITAILSVILLGEALSTGQYLLIGLIFISGAVLAYDEKTKLKSFLQPAIGIAFLYVLFSSLWNISIKQSIIEVGYWATTIWSYIISVIFLGLTAPLFWRDLKKVKTKQIGVIFFLSIGSVAASLFAFKALETNVSISSAIMNLPLSGVAAFLLSLFIPSLLEKHPIKVYLIRFSAVAVMILSAIQLSHQ